MSATSVSAVPPDVLRNWQRIVDLLANIMSVPSAVVTKMESPRCTRYEVIVSSNSKGNPFPIDEFFAMDIGTYCETVIKRREPLLVGNALELDQWKAAPETKLGMISYLGFPVFWPDGRVFGTICVLDDKANFYNDLYKEVLSHCRDVLQADLQTLARLGDELEEQEARLSELFARIPDGVVMLDVAFTITGVNPAFTKIFGYSAEEAIGQHIKDLITSDDMQEEVESLKHRIVRTEAAFTLDTVRMHKDGTRIPVTLICVPVPSREHVGYVIYRNMTEEKRRQEEQRRYRDLELALVHANRVSTLGQLSAAIAHELNQPLTGITTNCVVCSRMLTADPPDLHGVREALRRTLRDSSRAASVVERLRALFDKKGPVFEQVDLNETTREVLGVSQDEIQNHEVAIELELADDLPAVWADRVQLQLVVFNLLRNALDAMASVADHPRNVLIRTERQADDCVQLSLRDSGVGCDPDTIARLFEPFFSTKRDGMGVGLSVSRSIIENHQGRLWAVSNDGAGATFLFSIPSQRRATVR